jgi:flagellar hook-basal body complex protein FliE
MASPVSGISQLPALDLLKAPMSGPAQDAGFSSILADAVNRVEKYRLDAENKTERFLGGENEDIHQVVMSAQQAELSFELFLQAKNKVVQAYQEIMRMQI